MLINSSIISFVEIKEYHEYQKYIISSEFILNLTMEQFLV